MLTYPVRAVGHRSFVSTACPRSHGLSLHVLKEDWTQWTI